MISLVNNEKWDTELIQVIERFVILHFEQICLLCQDMVLWIKMFPANIVIFYTAVESHNI